VPLRSSLYLLTLVVPACLAGCGTTAYRYHDIDSPGWQARPKTQIDVPVRVSVAVPGRDETKTLIGLDFYRKGIQPVWLEFESKRGEADYSDLVVGTVYDPGRVQDVPEPDLKEALWNLPCCSTDASGKEQGEPVNAVFVGTGMELLQAPFRSDWFETSSEEAARREPAYLFERREKAIPI
jgi:hypothetical protein